MGLDFVLVHQQHHYLATEVEKLDYFVGKLGLISHLSRVSTDRGTARNTTTRYFADKFPLFLSGASRAPRPVVAFCYVDGTTGKPLALIPTCCSRETYSVGLTASRSFLWLRMTGGFRR